jgi:protein ImuA
MQGLLSTVDFFTEVPNRAVVLDELRRLLPGIADSRKSLPCGLDTVDSCLPEGGLTCGALHEVVPEAQAAMPAALGFITALLSKPSYPPPERGRSMAQWAGAERHPMGHQVGISSATPPPRLASSVLHSRCEASASLKTAAEGRLCPPLSGEGKKTAASYPFVFVMPAYGPRQYGRLYGHGLKAFGLDPARLILVEASRRQDILWAIEEAVRSGAPAAVAGMIDRLDLKTSQRLQLFAIEAGLPLFLLRPAQNLESSAAATRWRVGTAEAARDRFGLFSRARWHLRLERVRNGRPGEWIVEYDHVAHRFSLAAALADPAFSRDTNKKNEKNENAVRQAC